MQRELFTVRLAGAAERARDLASRYVVEPLPAAMRFRLRLNRSSDDIVALRAGEVVFPDDGGEDQARRLRSCDLDLAVDTLWRAGRVPEWVDVSVLAATGTATVFELLCCGRFTDDESLLYHVREGLPPFHVTSPVLPPGYTDGRFSVHRFVECWDDADLQHVTAVADNVCYLSLHTDRFDPAQLAALPALPGVEIFEHHQCTLTDNALTGFSRFPRLRVLRLRLTGTCASTTRSRARCTALTSLTIANLTPHPCRLDRLRVQAPALSDLVLAAQHTLHVAGRLPDQLDSLWLNAAKVTGRPRLPRRIGHLRVTLDHGSDADVTALLEPVTQIGSLSLRGTPIGDQLAQTLAKRYRLGHIDLTDTAVSDTTREQLSVRRPPRA